MAGPADAATQCQSHSIDYQAFLVHKVRATFRECHGGIYGTIPRQHIISVSTPIVTYPTNVPTGLGEVLTTTQKPYRYSWSGNLWKFRFTTKQQHVKVMPISSSYDFEIQVRSRFLSSLNAPVGRICFVNHACSSWQN